MLVVNPTSIYSVCVCVCIVPSAESVQSGNEGLGMMRGAGLQ